MQSKLFLLLFLFFIFSLTFSSKDKDDEKKRKRQPNEKNLDLQWENTYHNTQDTLNFVQPSKNAEIFENSNTQNIEKNTNLSALFQTKQEEIYNIPSDLLNIQETGESQTIPFDLLNTHEEEAESSTTSCALLNNIDSNIFRSIFAYLSFFELELNFKCTSTRFYNLYNKFLKEEKNMLKESLKNRVNFVKNLNCTRVYFDFFEKRFWGDSTQIEQIEYVNVNSFSKHLFLFPKSIRQIIYFEFNKIEYKYILFKNGDLSILKEGKFVFTIFDNDFANSLIDNFEKKQRQNIRWMMGCYNMTENANIRICLDLFKTDNILQRIWHHGNDQKIKASTPHKINPRVFLKNTSGFLQLESDGCVHLRRFEKQNNGKYQQSTIFTFKQNVEQIKSKDFEHNAIDAQFIFKN
jgi:hypothetical protein